MVVMWVVGYEYEYMYVGCGRSYDFASTWRCRGPSIASPDRRASALNRHIQDHDGPNHTRDHGVSFGHRQHS